MKTKLINTHAKRFSMLVVALLAISSPVKAALDYTGTLYWDPAVSGSTMAGGSGLWSAANAWRNDSTALTWQPGTAGTIKDYGNLIFGGINQTGTHTLTLDLDKIEKPLAAGAGSSNLTVLALRFSGDYEMKSSVTNGTTLAGTANYGAVRLYVDSGKNLHINGGLNPITIIGSANVSGNTSDAGAYPSVLLAGGGKIVMSGSVNVRQLASLNSRIAVGATSDTAMTTLDLNGNGVYFQGSRLWLDNATVNVNGANLLLSGHATSQTLRSVLHIGSGSMAEGAPIAPSVLNINSGTVSALANPSAAPLASGVWYLESGSFGSGGTINLNGGELITTNIQVNSAATASQTAEFIFNGGTLSVAASAVTDHLNTFINGFQDSETNRVAISAGGAYINTGAIAGKTAIISSVISGSGNFTKLGANTLQLSAKNTYTGTTIVSGGTLAMGTVADAIASSTAVIVESGAVLNAGNAGVAQTLRNLSGSGTLANGSSKLVAYNDTGESSTFAGSLVLGGGGFEKSGAGTLTLTANNSAVTATTLVSGGKLLLGNAATARLGGLVTVENGAGFGGLGTATGTVALKAGGSLLVGTSAAGSLTVSTLQLNTGSILDFAIDANNAASSLTVTNPIEFLGGSSAGDISINLDALISGTYQFGNIGAAFAGTGSASVTYAGALIGGRQSAILTNNAGVLQLVLDAGSSLKVVWTGVTDGIWNTTGTNWKKDGSSDQVPFALGDSVVFDDSLTTGRRDITLGSAIIVSDMTIGGTGNYTFTGHAITADKDQATGLAGTQGKLTMESTGTLTLAPDSTNSFHGGIDLKAGTLRAATAGAIGASNINVLGNATLLADAVALDVSGTVNFGAAAKTLTLNAGAASPVSLTGKVIGSGTLAKTGAGTLSLTGANSHTATLLSAGTLAFGHNTALGSTLAIGASGATMQAALADFSVASAMNLGANSFTFDTGANSGAWTGAIAGSGTLRKTGAGTLDIAAAGLAGTVGLDAAAGKIRISRSAAGNYSLANKLTGTGAVAVKLTGVADALSLGAGALSGFAGTFTVENASFALNAASAAEFGTAALGVGAGSRINKAAGNMTIAGLSLDGGAMQFAVSGISPDGILTVGSLNTGGAGTETSIMMDLGGGGSSTQFNPAIPPATNILDHDNGSATGEKVIAVTGSITGAGTLKLTGTDGNPVTGSITSIIEQYVPGSTTTKENVAEGTYGAALVTGTDGIYLGSALTAISVYNGKQLILDNAAPGVDNTFSIGISGSGGLIVRASGTIVLSGSNTYTGLTTLAAGVTRAARANIFRDSSAVEIASGATFEAAGNAQTLRDLSGAGAIVLGGAALTLESTATTTFSGALSGAGNITKTGAGTLVLDGNHMRGTGTTAIADGRLVVKNNFTALGSSAVGFTSASAVLELNNITSGTYTGAVTGLGTVEIRDSNLAFGNSSNRFSQINLVNSTVLPTSSVHAIGSTGAIVNIDSTSALYMSYGHSTTNTALNAGNVTVASGGKLLYGRNGTVNKFNLGSSGTLTLHDGAVLGFAGAVPDGIYDLIVDGAGTVNLLGDIVLDKGPNKMAQWRATDNGDIELITLSFDPTVQVSMTFDAMMAAMSAIYSRMSENFLTPLVEANGQSKINGLWMRGFASSAEYDETADQYGHTEDTYGVIIGFDALSNNRKYLMGVYGGFASSTLKTDANAEGDADQQYAGLYGAAKWGKFYIGLDGIAGWSKSKNTRHQPGGDASEGTSKANYFGGSAEIGLVFHPTETLTLKPAVGLHYLNAMFDAYKERGDSAIAYPDIDQDILQSVVTVQASWKFKMPWGWPGMFDLVYAWRQNVSEKSGDVPVTFVADTTHSPYVIRSGEYVRGSQSIGGGIRTAVNESLSLGIAYDFEIASNRTRHTVNGTVRWAW